MGSYSYQQFFAGQCMFNRGYEPYQSNPNATIIVNLETTRALQYSYDAAEDVLEQSYTESIEVLLH